MDKTQFVISVHINIWNDNILQIIWINTIANKIIEDNHNRTEMILLPGV